MVIEASAGLAIMQRATVVGWRYVVLGSWPLWQLCLGDGDILSLIVALDDIVAVGYIGV